MIVLTVSEGRLRWTMDRKLAMMRESFEPENPVFLVVLQHGVNSDQFPWLHLR
jgi:transposase